MWLPSSNLKNSAVERIRVIDVEKPRPNQPSRSYGCLDFTRDQLDLSAGRGRDQWTEQAAELTPCPSQPRRQNETGSRRRLEFADGVPARVRCSRGSFWCVSPRRFSKVSTDREQRHDCAAES